ncbi:hypothetical protein CSTERTH_08320 [Thermoclostridium stercorarium subsp. thermolacticum DSM 2910]|uniref:DUF2935 domain-containing protein n=1 Tax=Thermoclostridium stercorarium subsp. thermolacticum DSM 2910 TaxID=1121336 RepID=A0A1B1YE54_THEST|nr:DUF2935 domain-containing protein [Thermoclostridium stercorarium]ANW99030.1 hypothetical protein CSTERTH_08320 [Thermoclostridium stercorarium subsp. thermolacticum DSM 2910]
MLPNNEFIRLSLEINLFFQRLMKEHLFFIETALAPVNADYIAEAKNLKEEFERLLAETVSYSDRAISVNVISSNELVTPFTLTAEELTSALTGAELNTEITKAEYRLTGLTSIPADYYRESSENIVGDLNQRTINLLEEVIAFQKRISTLSGECRIFITLYNELLEHVTHEADYYAGLLKSLQKKELPRKTLCEELNFWNHLMGEHALFIDGMMDPSERKLKETARNFAEGFEKLVRDCVRTAEYQIKRDSLSLTEAIRNFKRAGTDGILRCRIKSIIPPLLADHVLREANHYLRLLEMING